MSQNFECVGCGYIEGVELKTGCIVIDKENPCPKCWGTEWEEIK